VTLKPVGTPFRDLVKALADSDNAVGLKNYRLDEAAKEPPESAKGLNIEGLTKTPQGTLLIGFRNPIPNGQALLVPLQNPDAVIVDGKKPKLGRPILLPLGGLGIRSIEYVVAKKAYIIIAGPFDDSGGFQLYQWSGEAAENPVLIAGADLKGLHPEAMVSYPDVVSKIQILSDDGSEQIGGKACKDLANTEMRFRSVWVDFTPFRP
jgi:hypothetical protein